MDLNTLRIFVRVAELESFTQAADQLGLAKGRVSAAVQRLEIQVGTRLLHRTTRHVRLTADGEQFLARCKDLIADAEQLQGMFQSSPSGLRGRLRIDLPNSMARNLIIPRLPEFLSAHPLLEMGISTSDRHVDVIQEGFDCVLRVGSLANTDLVARPLGAMKMCNVASPAYLSKYGTPKTLADLSQHRLIHYAATLGTQGAGWEWQDGAAVRSHPMHSAIVVNGTDAYQAACLAGLGLIQVPVQGGMPLVNEGLLVEVMPAFTAAPMPVSLLYPHRRQIAPRVHAILDWLTKVVTPYLME
ncbi:LysR substrate-binding domain-containing protein [Pollutimonas bauzanensis]|jgi:DNA-binding transcriptional LysR family regulator|uniref:LysR substrate-binding domain-containing protein n=1 Tax=Pollutimonas bauzanensis TaxID=658167 RepID=UPI003342BC7F